MAQPWAFEENFDNLLPSHPSQVVLPSTLDYAVTHRVHSNDVLNPFPIYRADHGPDCSAPAPNDLNMHDVLTTQLSSSVKPDPSFYVCKEHFMSSMGHVSAYSVSSFWPRQVFRFAPGGVLEFDVNVTENPGRFWWEILIAPRDQLTVAAAQDFWPIDETYPESRIVLTWDPRGKRSIEVGAGAIAPQGWLVNATDWREWRDVDANDPALTDRRLRRRMRIVFGDDQITWQVQRRNGRFDSYSAPLPDGYPFKQGLVLFKTHAYTPHKENNFDFTTWHWDNIRFNGPIIGRYDVFESDQLVYLEANGNRPVGDNAESTITLSRVSSDARLFGQIHKPVRGQVQVSVNGSAPLAVHPHNYRFDDCYSSGWSSFHYDVPAGLLRTGRNTFRWSVGKRPVCAPSEVWNGFSIKDLEVQMASIETGGDSLTTPRVIKVEAENYRQAHRAWRDSTPGNVKGAWRDDDVDVERYAGAFNGHVVSHIRPGEWLEYDVKVEDSGVYDLQLRYASARRLARRINIFRNSKHVGRVLLPRVQSSNGFATAQLRRMRLSKGVNRVRLRFASGYFRLDRLKWVKR